MSHCDSLPVSSTYSTDDQDKVISPELMEFFKNVLFSFFEKLTPGEPIPPGKGDKLEELLNRSQNSTSLPHKTLVNSFLLCGLSIERGEDNLLHITGFQLPEGVAPDIFSDPKKILHYWINQCLISPDYQFNYLKKDFLSVFARNLTPKQALLIAKYFRRKRLTRANCNVKDHWQNSEHQINVVSQCLTILLPSTGFDRYFLESHDNFSEVSRYFIEKIQANAVNQEFLSEHFCVGLILAHISPSLMHQADFIQALQCTFDARWTEYIPSLHQSLIKFLPQCRSVWDTHLPTPSEYSSPLFHWAVLSKKQRRCILSTYPNFVKKHVYEWMYKQKLSNLEPKKALKASTSEQLDILSSEAYLEALLKTVLECDCSKEITADDLADRFIELSEQGIEQEQAFIFWPVLLATALHTDARSVKTPAFRNVLAEAYLKLFSNLPKDFSVSARRYLRDAFGDYKDLWIALPETEESSEQSTDETSEQVANDSAPEDHQSINFQENQYHLTSDNKIFKTEPSTQALTPSAPDVLATNGADNADLHPDNPQVVSTEENLTIRSALSNEAIGRIVYHGSFPFWVPVAQRIGTRFVAMSPAEAKYHYPHFGMVRVDPQNIIKDYLYVIDWNKGDLQSNVDSKTLQVRTDTLWYVHSNRLMDEQRFTSIDQRVGYPVVYPRDTGLRRNETIIVSFSPDTDTRFESCCDIPVVLAIDGGFIGPYRLNQTQQGALTVNLPINVDNAIVKIYRPRHEGAVLDIGGDGPIHAVAMIHDESLFTTRDYDVLNDYLLMRKFLQALELSKKERQCALSWSDRYSTLQRVFSDNPGIKSTRIQRVKSLLTNESWIESLYELFDQEFETYKGTKEKRYTSLKPQMDRLTQENADLKQQIQALSQQAKTLSDQAIEAKTALKKAQEKAQALTQKHAVPTKMCSDATSHNEELDKRIAQTVQAVSKLPASDLTRQALAKYLVDSVQRYRSYTKNDILNAFIVMTQNYLTVFSGQPGSGKTSLCNIVAHVLGLSTFNTRTGLDNADRFLPVSVERGWTGKRDFIGYYNPLNKHFECVDPLRYEAFRLLDQEYRYESRFPFMILLDEANLSPMEYYWADFMNAGDTACGMNFINLGDNRRYHLPDTLRFIATINNDHTTETLSPRLIDRAWTIVLPSMSLAESSLFESDETLRPDDDRVQLITWQALENTFGRQSINPQDEAILWEPIRIFGEIFTKMHSISPRTRRSMLHYLNVAGKYLDGGRDCASDLAVVQKLLPQLSGTGQEYADWLNELLEKAKQLNWPRTTTQIERILREGRQAMGYYHFF